MYKIYLVRRREHLLVYISYYERYWFNLFTRWNLWIFLFLQGQHSYHPAVRLATPEPAAAISGRAALHWPLRFGASNTLQLSCWRWSGLGIGGALIALALALVLALERLRRLLGFGLPELPA